MEVAAVCTLCRCNGRSPAAFAPARADVETCLGVPNRRDRFDRTTILSYDGTSTSSGGMSIPLPQAGGVNFDGRGTSIRYNGEKDGTIARDSYCAPLVRACFGDPPQAPRRTVTAVPDPEAPLVSSK